MGSSYNLALSQRRTKAIIDYVQARIEKPARIYEKAMVKRKQIKLGRKIMLIAGSYNDQENVERLMESLKGLNF